jgi:hypothetical protein
MTLPTVATVLMIPLARPRKDVGNSSGPYTLRAGTRAAAKMEPTVAVSHMAGPSSVNDRARRTVPTTVPTAPTTRRPRVSAKRPPTTMPMLAGVDVVMMNSDTAAADIPRSSRRNSVRNCDCGVVNRSSRNDAPARSASRW